MKKSEIKILKEEYEAYKENLLYYQDELKKCKNDNDKVDIINDLNSCRIKMYFLEDLAFKLCIDEELGL